MADVSKKVSKEKSFESLTEQATTGAGSGEPSLVSNSRASLANDSRDGENALPASTMLVSSSTGELANESELVDATFSPPPRGEQKPDNHLSTNGKAVHTISVTNQAELDDTAAPAQEQGDGSEEVGSAQIMREGLALFELLDKDQRESLGRREARNWFRGLGWCISETQLDALMDDVPVSPTLRLQLGAQRTPSSPKAPTSPTSPKSPTAERRWTFSQLLELAERHRLEGPDTDALGIALRDICAGLSHVSREFLRKKVVECDVGVSAADVDEILDLCGYPGEFADPDEPLDTHQLVHHMAHAICHPRDHAQRGARAGGVVRQVVGGR